MSESWKDYERAAGRGPTHLGVKIIVAVFLLGSLVWGIGYVAGWFGEVAQVTQEEFGPRAMLRKYEWFKDVAAQLDAKRASLETMEADLKQTEAGYGNTPQTQWPRDAREDYNLQRRTLYGLKASYNNLAADYNAQMAKFNWRFANRGELPPGATEPLPREYKPYVTQ